MAKVPCEEHLSGRRRSAIGTSFVGNGRPRDVAGMFTMSIVAMLTTLAVLSFRLRLNTATLSLLLTTYENSKNHQCLSNNGRVTRHGYTYISRKTSLQERCLQCVNKGFTSFLALTHRYVPGLHTPPPPPPPPPPPKFDPILQTIFFTCIFVNDKCCILIKISLTFANWQ